MSVHQSGIAHKAAAFAAGIVRFRMICPFNAWLRHVWRGPYRRVFMKVSRLVSAAFVIIALGFASLSLSACQSTGDMNSSGASNSGTSGSSGGY
ncbi:conserved hypothetical protein [Paraburkholderia piptadeniae]|uniref:Uncharacterized protein n=1 Tax=Paraburkholderia piptadeniae TaxID=1701573 RepID=A0A1N7RN12_9BURK|nr:conserved hypothetical protein [Paraburkholderia piptadeniae]